MLWERFPCLYPRLLVPAELSGTIPAMVYRAVMASVRMVDR